MLATRHPWILDRTIVEPSIPPSPGRVVDLVSQDGKWLARGKYNPSSKIRVRVYQWLDDTALDEAWFSSQLDQAFCLRKQWMRSAGQVEAYRLVNSEGDGLSGLVVDCYGPYVVVQLNALAMQDWIPALLSWIETELRPQGVLLRVDTKLASTEGIHETDRLLAGQSPDGPIVIQEHGVAVSLDLMSAQKTGYYLDQRANRLHAARWARGRMLDVCTYLGGFALAASKLGNVESVLALDSSARALAEAEGNARLNGIRNIEFSQADCFEGLDKLSSEQQIFDTIVLDPPKLAGSRQQQPAALRAYHRLNSQAMKLLRSGGILITCSCSGRVSREDFTQMLAPAARRAGRAIQIVEQRGADIDHPWSIHCPETEYLKCFICRVVS